ncbi:DUF2627 domain-containing protein [Paenibacillus arenosi]|uniref:DUF2627 domain-containing protein n=1 Tax=Paenibacillus arenosi TaxID=2774142 RepID=A0ABR9AUC1_9BACL|nr:DUF2627 domain-containing protein [Paenibacillus arenosi]MBD8497709.1 DUF2627 domain-containing protein [Paenibacillus arenosi]
MANANVKLTISRFIAIMMLVIPGVLATAGFLYMKDAIYQYIVDKGNPALTDISFGWLPFLVGLFLFAIGVGFIGGWIFFRDRKHNYVAPRFREKKPRGPRPDFRQQATRSQHNSGEGQPAEVNTK